MIYRDLSQWLEITFLLFQFLWHYTEQPNLYPEEINRFHGIERKTKAPASKRQESVWWTVFIPCFFREQTGTLPTPSQFQEPPSHSQCTYNYVFCIQIKQRLPNSWTLAGSQVPKVGTLPPPRRRKWQGLEGATALQTPSPLDFLPPSPAKPHFWKARLHLLWVRSVSERNLISYQAVTDELFGCMWPQAEAWASHSCGLPSTAECGPRRSWPEGAGPPWRSPGQTRPARALGAGSTGLWGVSCVPSHLDVLFIICSSSDGRCDKLWNCGPSCAHGQLKRAFVSWSFASSGWEPRSSAKGKKANQSSHSWLSGRGTEGARDTSQN